LARLLVFAYGMLFVCGCSGLNPAVDNDPLLGGPSLPVSTPAARPASTNVAPAPPPSANSILSPAALAAGAPRPADNGNDLRIGSQRGNAGNDGWARGGPTGKTPDSAASQIADGSGAFLRPPEPATEPAPRRELAPVSNPGSARASRFTTFEQARDEITARGALWQKLETVGENGEWKYSCSIPNRQNPRMRRTYEARASDPAGAIRLVIEQLDKEM
jgi:hypothetical protein